MYLKQTIISECKRIETVFLGWYELQDFVHFQRIHLHLLFYGFLKEGRE